MQADSETATTDSLSFIVDEAALGLRVDVIARQVWPNLSRSRIQKLIAAQQVTRNSEPTRSSDVVSPGDRIELRAQDRVPAFQPRPAEFEVLFEDQFLLIADKPRRMNVHPGSETADPSLIEAIVFDRPTMAGLPGGSIGRPGVVHRLDRDTTGVICVAKTPEAFLNLSQQFRERTARRVYHALLDGVFHGRRAVESYLGRDPAMRRRFRWSLESKPEPWRFARSHLRAIEHFQDRLTLAQVTLETGRTHQIRVHAKQIGCPVVGDLLYHRPVHLPHDFSQPVRQRLCEQPYQLLHASCLRLKHPVTSQPMEVYAPLPRDFDEVLVSLQSTVRESLL